MNNEEKTILKLREEKQRYQNNHVGISNLHDLHASGKTAFNKRITKQCNDWLDKISDHIEGIDEKLCAMEADLDV